MRYAFVLAVFVLAANLIAQEAPIPPADAEWTILCVQLTGPDHIRQANRGDLVRRTGLRELYVIHGDTDSKVLYGFYRTVESSVDKKESERAKADLARVQEFATADGVHPFARAYICQINPPDPNGPAEWNLLNVNKGKATGDPTRAVFTLEIGAYKDSPERKKAAVDSVRDARAKGIEAYYFHGDSISSVCIGAWPRNAIADTGESTRGAAEPVAVSTTPLSQAMIDAMRQKDPSLPDKVMTPNFKPIDPTMIKAIRDYPNHSVNGVPTGHRVFDPENRKVIVQPDYSTIVEIPELQNSLIDSVPIPSVAPPPAALARPIAPSGSGKLKSLDE